MVLSRPKSSFTQHQAGRHIIATTLRTHDTPPPPHTYTEVKANINAPADLTYAACSKEVDAIMGHDVMKSVAHLVPDLLDRSHVLLYQGQFDAECGVASNEAWISKLTWWVLAGCWLGRVGVRRC